MILIYSDFGTTGPYGGAMQAAVLRQTPHAPVIDLMVDAPDRNPRAAAFLLAALRGEFRPGDIGLCVVDPGVGGTRKGLMVRCDDVWFVGPDNGLFEILIRRAQRAEIWQIDWCPDVVSPSFHGRDIFGPVAAMLYEGLDIGRQQIMLSDRDAGPQGWPDDLAEIIYIDGYGNAMTGLRAATHDGAVMAGGRALPHVRTFGDVALGQGLVYQNSFGLLEIAVNGDRADRMFGLSIGSPVHIATKNGQT
ncbi:MAG: SAM-dependent chlorinase/fluorinase [Pseudomonadota bacterium]